MNLYFYNSASLKKEPFKPLEPGHVKMYCCGPTVYNYAHIGNLRTYLFEDFLRRTLEYFNYTVTHVTNITDVGHLTSDADTGLDKLEKGAERENISVWDLAQKYTDFFWSDCQKLNILKPHHSPKATDYIESQIKLVQTLESKGYTYAIQDGIYFDTAKFPSYADFARLDIDNLEAGKRVTMAQGKRNLTDFALWKLSPTDVKRAMEWDSPWGKGFPGWHIECSAMAMELLGEQLDIHCGGVDHLKIHHTNEIAQSECATKKQFAQFWLHGGWLLQQTADSSGKMSKSSGDFVRLETLLNKGFSALDYRYFCMNSHYKNYLNFTWEALEASQKSLNRLKEKAVVLCSVAKPLYSSQANAYQEQWQQSIADDLNIPKALGILHTLLKDDAINDTEKGTLLLDFDKVLGLDLHQLIKSNTIEFKEEWYDLIDQRNKARNNKDFTRADEIRDFFKAQGIELKDNSEGTNWKFI